eukprot:95571-Amphidinium_carterae.1
MGVLTTTVSLQVVLAYAAACISVSEEQHQSNTSQSAMDLVLLLQEVSPGQLDSLLSNLMSMWSTQSHNLDLPLVTMANSEIEAMKRHRHYAEDNGYEKISRNMLHSPP